MNCHGSVTSDWHTNDSAKTTMPRVHRMRESYFAKRRPNTGNKAVFPSENVVVKFCCWLITFVFACYTMMMLGVDSFETVWIVVKKSFTEFDTVERMMASFSLPWNLWTVAT